MNLESLTLITPNTRPDYRRIVAPIASATWPEFMLHDPIADQYWDDLFTRFSDCQFAFLDSATQDVVGIANSVPLSWDGDPAGLPEAGWDWAMRQSVADHATGRSPRLLCAIQIAIMPAYQGRGLSAHFVQAMRSLAAGRGFTRLIAPVRPSLKSRYPLTPVDRYVRWHDPNGLPFDPWLRVHARLGARLVKPCHQAMRITGTVAEWEAWAGMAFPESGPYIVPGALVPVDVDCETDQGTYVEPNVWMVHELGHRSR